MNRWMIDPDLPNTTAGLIAYCEEHTDLSPGTIERSVGRAIDTLYSMRDAGASMHQAGAAVALAALGVQLPTGDSDGGE